MKESVPDKEIPSILGLKGIKDGSGARIGYKMLDYSKIMLTQDADAAETKKKLQFKEKTCNNVRPISKLF